LERPKIFWSGSQIAEATGRGTPGAKEQAAGAIWGFASNKDNKVTLMKLGAAP
jgi:hypothetical protein